MKILKEENFNKDSIVQLGNKYLTGNGYIGYRGTLCEYTKQECVGLNVASVYDGVKGKWRETINTVNPLYMETKCENQLLSVFENNYTQHQIELDIYNAIFTRTTKYLINDITIDVVTERFCNYDDKNNISSRTYITANKDVKLEVMMMLDDKIWELNGPHYSEITFSANDSELISYAKTQELNHDVIVSLKCNHHFSKVVNNKAYLDINLKSNEPFILDRVCQVLVNEKLKDYLTYDEYKKMHLEKYTKTFKKSSLELKDDSRGQFALDYSIYHLLIIAPKGHYSIAARGLSGQTYKGAIFWDTEIFMLPFYLNTNVEVARNLVMYRIKTLPQAKQKASSYGYMGAFYAWESQDGYDACSDFNVVDVFTHRPVRTYFKDKQIHISADISYAIINYFNHTNDYSVLIEGGLETLIECALFARSYSYYNHMKGRYELLDVIGPDEYHERVNNNAFTNYMFYETVKDTISIIEKVEKHYESKAKEILSKYDSNLKEILTNWLCNLYLPKPNENGIIEQFDGYLKLEDCSVSEVRSRLVNKNEYWGGSTGVATATRVIKQADLIMLFNLYPNLFTKEIQKVNYDFYKEYTEHGSSLSHCAYSLCASRLGETKDAYKAFLDSAEIDLRGTSKQWAGEIYIGGTHPAASGGAWMCSYYGFKLGEKNEV